MTRRLERLATWLATRLSDTCDDQRELRKRIVDLERRLDDRCRSRAA